MEKGVEKRVGVLRCLITVKNYRSRTRNVVRISKGQGGFPDRSREEKASAKKSEKKREASFRRMLRATSGEYRVKSNQRR